MGHRPKVREPPTPAKIKLRTESNIGLSARAASLALNRFNSDLRMPRKKSSPPISEASASVDHSVWKAAEADLVALSLKAAISAFISIDGKCSRIFAAAQPASAPEEMAI